MEAQKHAKINPVLLQQFPILKNISVLEALRCKGDNYGNFVCLNKECQLYPFVCQNKKCVCRKQHQKCLKNFVQQFVQRITSNVFNKQNFFEQKFQAIDKVVQNIVNEILKIKEVFKQHIKKLNEQASFTPHQKIVLKKLQKNQVLDLKGKDMEKAYSDAQQKVIQNSLDFSKNSEILLKQLLQIEHNVVIQFQNLRQTFKIQKNVKSELMKSKIITNQKEEQVLKGFFNRKILGFQMLYRASQNKFKLSQFYNKCSQSQNTLILIQTQFGKKIGGFTQLQWQRYQKDDNKSSSCCDSTLQTFTFSISNNEKLKQKNEDCGIVNYKSWILFGNKGGYGHIGICEEANEKKNSYVQFGYGYENSNYKQDNYANWNTFAGNLSQNDRYFFIKEWEVWKINF